MSKHAQAAEFGRRISVDFTIIPGTPVGSILLAGTKNGLKHLRFCSSDNSADAIQPAPDWQQNDRAFREIADQLKAYFRKKLTSFKVSLDADGTDFQKKVWQALMKVPYGATASYGQIAKAIGQPTASRAVGMANGKNPIAIIVPCHRIIGTNGQLVGYGGGLHNKMTLLQLENAVPKPLTAG